ncbi:hypothetical protein CE91St43_08480 [Oscillospiraceae bacterium]|nr:hypothetical protein CE91St43_08480 [Oscillospiraceae bacterium]
MSNKQNSNIPWWVIVLGFIFFWPIGMVLLFMNLGGVQIPTDKIKQDFQSGRTSTGAGPYAPSGSAGQQQRRQTPPTASSFQAGAVPPGDVRSGTGTAQPRQGQGTGQQRQARDPGRVYQQAPRPVHRGKKPMGGTLLTIFGAICSLSFFIAAMGVAFGTGFVSGGAIVGFFTVFGFLCASLFMTGTGISMTRRARRQRLYLGAIGQRTSIFISDLAGAAGVSERKCISDLQKMLSDGILPMGYIDRATGRLVLTDQGYERPAAPQPEPEPERPADSDDDILRQIKEINDAIPGEEMSRKIDRVGEITGKILDYQRQNPAKAGQLRQFLNYYLPTTLKLLKTYAQLDAQGVEGENITAAKARIENMMDKVVEGFEKQLDQLFQSDAMDIATDVAVLERMLDKDGLGTGMTM